MKPQGITIASLTTIIATVAAYVPAAVAGNMPPGVELRAFLNDTCVVADEPYYLPPIDDDQVAKALPLAGMIVGKLAYALVNGIVKVSASGLEDLSKQKDLHYVAAYDFDVYRASVLESPDYVLNDRLACVAVIAAKFEPPGSDCMHRYVPKSIPPDAPLDGDLAGSVTRDDRSVENILRRANICIDGQAHSVYEGRFKFSEDQTAFRLESAGLWVNSLLSTKSRKAKRSVIYTFDISEPGQDANPQYLVSAAVPIGQVKPGTALETDTAAWRSDWLQVPPMSRRALTAYERDTAVHQDVYGEIQSLERSVKRNRHMLQGLESRIGDATSEKVQEDMQREIENTEFKTLRMEALLDARKAEYEELPHLDRYYMPVTVGVGVIESRSERRATKTLAALLKNHSSKIAKAATDAIEFERSVDLLDDEAAAEVSPLEQARSSYFDALVAAEEAREFGNPDLAAIEKQLSLAREAYNRARASAGIDPID